MIAVLQEEAKLDVNEYFASGATAADFEAVLASAQTPLELLISRLSIGPVESRLDPILEPILCAVKVLSPVEQDLHLRMIQRQVGKERITLEALRKQLQATEVEIPANSKVKTFPEHAPPPQPENTAGLPSIQVNFRQLRHVVADAWAAVLRANQPSAGVFKTTPYVFRRGEHVVYLADRPPTIAIEQMGEDAVYGLIARVADWNRARKEDTCDAIPMKEVARDMLAYIDPCLPQLDAVLSTPVFGYNGSLMVDPGYHKQDNVWMDDDSTLHMDPLSSTPTPNTAHLTIIMIGCQHTWGVRQRTCG